MGLAGLTVLPCYSYNGSTCGISHPACPVQGQAMTIGLYERQQVHEEGCVGCGLCEQACVHLPQAVRVRDRGRFS